VAVLDLPDGDVRLTCRPEHEARFYENGLSHDAFGRLGDVRCPVTLACGERTDTVGADQLRLCADRLPRARVTVLPGLGHLGPMEGPATVAAAIGAVLRA
jgi:3-oxoadipate enol-lactonase